MDGGAWLRLQCADIMGTTRVVRAVVASAIIRDFGASERRYSALAAYCGLLRLAWRPSGDGPCARLPKRIGMVQSLVVAYVTRTICTGLWPMPQSWWRGRAEERRGIAIGDGAFRLTALARTVRLKKWTC